MAPLVSLVTPPSKQELIELEAMLPQGGIYFKDLSVTDGRLHAVVQTGPIGNDPWAYEFPDSTGTQELLQVGCVGGHVWWGWGVGVGWLYSNG